MLRAATEAIERNRALLDASCVDAVRELRVFVKRRGESWRVSCEIETSEIEV